MPIGRVRSCGLALVLVACGSGKPASRERDAAPPTTLPGPAPVGARLPAVQVGDATLTLRGAVAFSDEETLELVLTPAPLPCAEARGSGDALILELRRHLEPSGDWTWRYTGARGHELVAESLNGPTAEHVTIDPTPGGRVSLELALERSASRSGELTRFAVAGTLDAESCGPSEPAATVPVAQPGAFVEIEGHRAPIVGAALVVGVGGVQLLVASEPVRCLALRDGAVGELGSHGLAMPMGDPVVSLKLERPTGGEWTAMLEGRWTDFAAQIGATLRFLPELPPADASEVELVLGGTTSSIGDGYDTSWIGTVTALICR